MKLEKEIENLIKEGHRLLSIRNQDSNNIDLAKEKFELALQKESNSAKTLASLSEVYTLLVGYGKLEQNTGLVKAREYIERALRSGPEDNYVLRMLYRIKLYVDLDISEAKKVIDKILDTDPSDTKARLSLVEMLFFQGNSSDGFKVLEEIEKSTPNSITPETLAWYSYYSTKYERAEEILKSLLQAKPEHRNAKIYLARVFGQLEKYDEALELWKQLQADDSNSGLSLYGEYTSFLAKKGDQQQALNNLSKIDKKEKEGGIIQQYRLAQIKNNLSLFDKAFDHLNESIRKKEPFILWVKMDPVFKNIRNDDRFKSIVERIGLK